MSQHGELDFDFLSPNLVVPYTKRKSDVLITFSTYLEQIKAVFMKKNEIVNIKFIYSISDKTYLHLSIYNVYNENIKQFQISNETLCSGLEILNEQIKNYLIEVSKPEPKEEIIIDGRIYKLVK